jgi:Concanavalin A-like lectin/glucanases superfamily
MQKTTHDISERNVPIRSRPLCPRPPAFYQCVSRTARKIAVVACYLFVSPAVGRAAVDFDNGDRYTASAPVTAAPCTIMARINADALMGNRTLVTAVAGTTNNNDALCIQTSGTTPRCYASHSGFGIASAPSAITTGTWQVVTGVFTSTSSRTCYLANSAGTPNTSPRTPAGIDNLQIAESGGEQFVGQMCEMAVWNTALSSSDITRLNNGWRAVGVQPASLVFYYSGRTATTSAEIGGTLTATGTPTTTTDPSGLIYPPELVLTPAGM